MSALEHQVGGSHYKKLAIQPFEYIHANGIGFAEGSAIKYITRWRDKGGIGDLLKAKHFIELLIEAETIGLDKLAPKQDSIITEVVAMTPGALTVDNEERE